jgi:NADH-quinone oxidoreductase subunit G
MITIEVDGRSLKARPGAMLIEVTDAAGIPIPRFCYHEKLSIAANCRMCLVEVEKVPKPLPACATPVTDGMKVHTRSPLALAAQKGTMEFLLINHPLDCPICDQGGECELQDVAMGYGGDVSRFAERKRVVMDQDIGPLIATDMTRCIHCTRCVRFGDEIAGLRELGATGRGEHTKIGTYIAHSVSSELSGNVIDLCPVGALTSKPFRYQARAWELIQKDGIAPHDSVGSNIHLHLRGNRVMRVHPRANEAVNEVWISDRDRFSYQGLYSQDRLTRPLLKRDGAWQEIDWRDALEAAAIGLKQAMAKDPDQFASLVSPGATLEELYLAQRLTRGLGSANIDHRLRQANFRGDASDPALPWLGMPVAALQALDASLLIGSNVRKTQPLLGHRLRKAALKGARIAFLNPLAFDLNYHALQLVRAPGAMAAALAGIAKALGASAPGAAGALIEKAKAGKEEKRIADSLKKGERSAVFLGDLAIAHPDYALLRDLAAAIAKVCGATLGWLPEAANSVGARLAGAVPHREPGGRAAANPGADAGKLLAEPRKAYLLLGLEPDFDCWNPSQANATLQGAQFVVALSAYRSPSLEACADLLLPVAGFAETSGTYVNAEGRWQSFTGATVPQGEAKPGWKVLRVLGNLLDLDGFEYGSSEQVRDELRELCADLELDNTPGGAADHPPQKFAGLTRIGDVPLYALDPLVRRAGALQQTVDAVPACIRINSVLAQAQGLEGADSAVLVQGEGRATLPLRVDPRVPDDCVWVSAGLPGTQTLGGQFDQVTLEKG